MIQRTFRFFFPLLVLIAAGCAMSSAAWAEASSVTRLFTSSFGHEAKGNSKAALNDALQIVRADPQNYVANLRLAWLYYKQERYPEAIRFYQNASALEPMAMEPRLGMLLPLVATKRWVEAEREARWVLSRAPHNYQASSRLAYALFLQGRYGEAESIYSSVLENFPSDIDMMLGLGWTYVRQGRNADARDMFTRVLSIREDNLSAKSGMQLLYLELGAQR